MTKVLVFIREHISFVVFQLLLVLFILLIYWLDGFRNYATAIYTIIMCILLTMGYLSGKFIMRRTFYDRITRKPEKMEAALIRHVHTPEHFVTTEYMRQLYKLYQQEVQTLYTTQHRHLHFMNQWVHQMKTPISVIGLLLEEEQLDKASIREEIEKIRRGLEVVLVNARLETFEEDMQIERIRLKELVQAVITNHKRLFIANSVFPVVSIDEHYYVATDSKWIKIVLDQFITNAVKYTFEKGKRIYFTAQMVQQEIQLSIRDEGVGIPSADLRRIAKPFFTGENGRLIGESTGMGLFIATEVCERLGHSFSIESTVGEGTTVTIGFRNGEAGEQDDAETDRGTDRNHEDL